MADLNRITELEQVYFELAKIRRQVDVLSDFIASKLRDQHGHAPQTEGMIDPRTNKPFKKERTDGN